MQAERAAGIEPAIEWLRRQGYRVVPSLSSWWYNAAPGVLQAFPYHWLITPSERELQQVIRRGRAVALRYSTPLTSPIGKISYHVVCSDPAYGLEQVSRQTRQNIKKGIEYAAVEPIRFSRLAEEGWVLRAETLARQGRLGAESSGWWKRLCLAAEGLPGFEAWGAHRDGRLLAALMVYQADDCYVMLYQQSLTAFLKHGVNNALGFVFTQRALARPGVKRLFYGLQSLDASWKVDEFKLRMGYIAEPVRQRVLFHPALRPLVRRPALNALDYLGSKSVRGARWLKAAGMTRFCLDGDRPLSQQECPECLLGSRQEWLPKRS